MFDTYSQRRWLLRCLSQPLPPLCSWWQTSWWPCPWGHNGHSWCSGWAARGLGPSWHGRYSSFSWSMKWTYQRQITAGLSNKIPPQIQKMVDFLENSWILTSLRVWELQDLGTLIHSPNNRRLNRLELSTTRILYTVHIPSNSLSAPTGSHYSAAQISHINATLVKGIHWVNNLLCVHFPCRLSCDALSPQFNSSTAISHSTEHMPESASRLTASTGPELVLGRL